LLRGVAFSQPRRRRSADFVVAEVAIINAVALSFGGAVAAVLDK